MGTFYAMYPPAPSATDLTNASVGLVGSNPAPGSATEIGALDHSDGTLLALTTSNIGGGGPGSFQCLDVNVHASDLPLGAARGAPQVDGSQLTQVVDANTIPLGPFPAIGGVANMPTKEATSSTATLTNVNGSTSSVSLLASNANRLGAIFYNDSTAILYLKFGTTASTTSYTTQIASQARYELPSSHTYTGAIDGIWAAANGAVRITELT